MQHFVQQIPTLLATFGHCWTLFDAGVAKPTQHFIQHLSIYHQPFTGPNLIHWLSMSMGLDYNQNDKDVFEILFIAMKKAKAWLSEARVENR